MRALRALLLLLLAACAAPVVTLEHRFEPGAARSYTVEVIAEITVGSGDEARTETETLTARSRVEVLDRDPLDVLRVTVTPLRRSIAGSDAPLPSPDSAEITILEDGTLGEVRRADGLPPDIAGIDASGLASLLGPPLPGDRVRLSERWRVSTPGGGQQQGRVRGLRVVGGFDCAIVELGVTRPVERVRSSAGTTVRLAGTERATTEIAFAFRDGFPVEVTTDAEALLQVRTGGAPAAERVIIATRTVARLDQEGSE